LRALIRYDQRWACELVALAAPLGALKADEATYAADLRELRAANASAASVVAGLRHESNSLGYAAPTAAQLARCAKANRHLAGRPL
jgi:hypothetical protein